MSKPKKKFGLQKDFSTIFEGVWIPPKPRSQDAQPEPDDEDRLPEDQSPDSAPEDSVGETAAADELDQSVEMPEMDELGHSIEREPMARQDYTPNAASEKQAFAIETPLTEEQPLVEDADAQNEPNPEIEKIISSMKCSKGFVCYKSNFEQLCKVTNVSEGKIIECSPVNQGPCAYRFSFMGKIFCKCPLRYYIARNLEM